MLETVRLTTAQALIKFLNQQYVSVDGIETPFVEGVFAVFGHGNVLGIGQALEQEPGHLKVLQGKNEQGMTQAAVAYSRQKLRRKIFACTASAGPGSANMITAAGTAFANNIPVLLLPADIFATRQPDPVLQQIEQEFSPAITTNDAFKAVSRYWDRIQRPEQLMSSLLKAFEVMTNPATAGPATICLSQDTEGEAYDYALSFFEKRVHYLDRQLPTKRELKGAVERIKSAKKPVIFVGGGARYSGARDALMTLSEQCGIPLVETHAGKSTVEATFINNFGGTGILGTLAANRVVQDADLVIGVGTRYTDFTTSSKTAFNYKQTRFLNININRMQSYKFDAFQVVADARATLEALLTELTDYHTTFGRELSEYKEEWFQERARLARVTFDRHHFVPEIKEQFDQEVMNEYAEALNTELAQTTAFLAVNESVAGESVVVASAGSLPGDMHRLWESKITNTYHMEYGYSCMGYEISGALGVKIAEPEKEVYAMVGDGSFLMLHSELITALQYGYKINVMLFDNSGFGCINNLQMENGSASLATEFRTADNQVMVIDYAKVAAGYGCKVYRVNTKESLIAAIEDAKKQTVATLIDIKVLPKTMTDGYLGWWRVGVAAVSTQAGVQQAYRASQEMIEKKAKRY